MKRPILNPLAAALLGLALLAAPAARAADGSTPSLAASELSGTVVAGSIVAVSLTGSVVVEAVDASAEGIALLLRGAGNASRATVRLSARAAEGLSLAAGTVLDVTVASTGYVLVLSGKAIAFIPNELGQTLLRHSRAG